MPTRRHDPTPAAHAAARRDRDAALLSDLSAPPSVEDAREAYDYWRQRSARLPRYKRAERNEAQLMIARCKERLAAAERERFGPGLIEQLLRLLGIRRLPDTRRLIKRARLLAMLVALSLIVLIVAVGVFWHELEPIARTLLGSDRGGGG